MANNGYNTTHLENASMSGNDAYVLINGKHVGTVQAISVTTQREVASNYVLNSSPHPVSHSKGKVATGGSLVGLVFHTEKLTEVLGFDKWILVNFDDDHIINVGGED